jgi:uncharacterized protein Yka (UPF0111/DUF47 family)
MSYNNHHEEESRPVSREEFGELIETLEQILANDSPNIQVALQPTVTALKELAANQIALRKEAIEDREKVSRQLKTMSEKLEKIDLQSGEIDTLKQQNRRLADWLLKHFQWKKIAGAAIFITVIAIAASAFLQNMALSNLGKAITEQQGAILGKVKEIDKKTKR